MFVLLYSGEICIVPGTYRSYCSHATVHEYAVEDVVKACEAEVHPVGWILEKYKDIDIPDRIEGTQALLRIRDQGLIEIRLPYH